MKIYANSPAAKEVAAMLNDTKQGILTPMENGQMGYAYSLRDGDALIATFGDIVERTATDPRLKNQSVSGGTAVLVSPDTISWNQKGGTFTLSAELLRAIRKNIGSELKVG